MREVKLALLEADVNFLVVKKFIQDVTERAVGQEVLESLTPGQHVIKIVNEEMTRLMGGANAKLEFGSATPAVVLMAGLQGAGKTNHVRQTGSLFKKAIREIASARRVRYLPPGGYQAVAGGRRKGRRPRV